MTDRQAALAMQEAAVAVLQKRREFAQENLQYFASLGNEVETAHAAQAIKMFDEVITEMSGLSLPDEPAVADEIVSLAEFEARYSVMCRWDNGTQRCFIDDITRSAGDFVFGPVAKGEAETELLRRKIACVLSAALPAPAVDIMWLLDMFYETSFRLGYDEAAEVNDDMMERRQSDSDQARAALVAAIAALQGGTHEPTE